VTRSVTGCIPTQSGGTIRIDFAGIPQSPARRIPQALRSAMLNPPVWKQFVLLAARTNRPFEARLFNTSITHRDTMASSFFTDAARP
jgi:hypothetical protein